MGNQNSVQVVDGERNDVIGESAIIKAIECGQTNRYQKPLNEQDKDLLLKAEIKMAKFIGTKYALGVNSGASAIFLVLKAIESRLRNKIVYTNAFTFNAVPSSIVHAGLTPVLVETTEGLVVDLEDLETQFQKHNGGCFVLSYMRGFVPNLEDVLELCKKYDVIMVEDAAHAYGIKYKDQMIGTFGIASCLSTQSNKLINTGEGGFIMTNDDDIQAYCIIGCGCYEKYYLRHLEMCPPEESIQKVINRVPNYSMRLSNIQGAMVNSQIGHVQHTIDKLNETHAYLREHLNSDLQLILQIDEVTQPVYDSIQVRIKSLSDKQASEFAEKMRTKYKFQIFKHEDNARYFKSWKFMENDRDLKQTQENLTKVYDMRVSHKFTKEDCDALIGFMNKNYEEVCESN